MSDLLEREGLAAFVAEAIRLMDADGLGQYEVVEKLMTDWIFTDADRYTVMRRGLSDLLSERRKSFRHDAIAEASVRPGVRQVTPTGRALYASLFSKVDVPIDALGGYKTLWACTLSDLDTLESYAQIRAENWRKRKEVYEGLADMCRTHKVATVAALPSKALDVAAAWVKEAWG